MIWFLCFVVFTRIYIKSLDSIWTSVVKRTTARWFLRPCDLCGRGADWQTYLMWILAQNENTKNENTENLHQLFLEIDTPLTQLTVSDFSKLVVFLECGSVQEGCTFSKKFDVNSQWFRFVVFRFVHEFTSNMFVNLFPSHTDRKVVKTILQSFVLQRLFKSSPNF